VEPSKKFSGQLRIRLPVSLHRDAWKAARREGVSLNQFIASVLSAAVAVKKYAAESEAAEEERRRAADLEFQQLMDELTDD
jgi:hypothetical protein